MIKTENKTEVRPMLAEDMLWVLEDGVKEFGLKFLPHEQLTELALARENNGQCITGVVDGRIVGCGGIDVMWPGVGEVWVMLSYEIDRFPKRAYKVIVDGLKKLIKDNDLWRIQAWGRVDFPQAHTLFRHLGFEVEGKARKYSVDGVDCILYAKVNDDIRPTKLF